TLLVASAGQCLRTSKSIGSSNSRVGQPLVITAWLDNPQSVSASVSAFRGPCTGAVLNACGYPLGLAFTAFGPRNQLTCCDDGRPGIRPGGRLDGRFGTSRKPNCTKQDTIEAFAIPPEMVRSIVMKVPIKGAGSTGLL